MRVSIVAPCHIQPSKEWVDALERERRESGADVFIVDDSDGQIDFPCDWNIYGYDKQRDELGHSLYNQFKQFHKSAACKNFGTWLSYKLGYDVVIVIDSDCIIPDGFVAEHIGELNVKGDGWSNPIDVGGMGFYSRGFPYSKRNIEKWAHMGLWENELDLYGTDRIGNTPPKSAGREYTTSDGAFFPLSGMNVSFKREAIPYMLFLPNFDYGDSHFTRHDDIWGGYIFEKIAHAKNKALSYGEPYVYHDTVVVPEEDAAEEVAMIKHEDDFYKLIDLQQVYDWDQQSLFDELADVVAGNSVFAGLAPAFGFWAEAFENLL